MTPQVRETQEALIAGPRIHPETEPVQIFQIAPPVQEITVQAAKQEAVIGTSMVEKRRRRQARMRSRH